MHVLWRGSLAQRLRLGSGLILFGFAATHFINHALGLISLDAMMTFDAWRTAVTRSLPGTVLLFAALLVHAGLALGKFIRRRTLQMPHWESWQIALGLVIPIMLIPHIVNTRIASSVFGVRTTYPFELVRIWTATIGTQTILMAIVWLHGCIGIHFWLRLASWYRRVAPFLLAVAVLIPFAAFTGVSVQGRAMNAAIADPITFAVLKADTHWPDAATQARIVWIRDTAQTTFCVALLALLGFVAIRLLMQDWARRIRIGYVAGPQVRTDYGPTLLEISRANNIPHMAVCGGRGRCSTCRVLVMSEASGLDAPTQTELDTLVAIKAGPNVRLACQARPRADTTLMPLLRVSMNGHGPSTLAQKLTHDGYAGIEQDLAVLFVDMRGFTTLTEQKLAFDVVFILNQFFATVGQPVYDMGGWISNYAGDGMIALFSDNGGVGTACRAALLAAAQIDRAVAALNERLSEETQQPIRIAMGLHAGPHVIGRVGYRESQAVTVIGLAINVASRLEALAKAEGAQIALSMTVGQHAGLDVSGLQIETRDVRGLEQPLEIVFMEAAHVIASRLRAPVAA